MCISTPSSQVVIYVLGVYSIFGKKYYTLGKWDTPKALQRGALQTVS